MFWSDRQLEQQPFHGAAVHFVRRQIHLGQLQPNEQLPPERKLAETLGISRVTLREAIKVLEDGEYIVSRRGAKGGTFVTDEDHLNEIASRNIVRDPGTAWRLLEYLKANLLFSFENALDRRSPGDLAALGVVAERLRNAQHAHAMREIRFSFLATIGHASGNPYFTEAITKAMDGLFHPVKNEQFIVRRHFLTAAFTKAVEVLKKRGTGTSVEICDQLLEDLNLFLTESITARSARAVIRSPSKSFGDGDPAVKRMR